MNNEYEMGILESIMQYKFWIKGENQVVSPLGKGQSMGVQRSHSVVFRVTNSWMQSQMPTALSVSIGDDTRD